MWTISVSLVKMQILKILQVLVSYIFEQAVRYKVQMC